MCSSIYLKLNATNIAAAVLQAKIEKTKENSDKNDANNPNIPNVEINAQYFLEKFGNKK